MGELLGAASILVAAIGSAAVTAALLYASRQTQLLQKQLGLENEQAASSVRSQRAANDLQLMNHVLSLDRLFIDHPNLRPHFYEDAPVPTNDPARSRVLSTAEMIVDIADSVASMTRQDQLHPETMKAWAAALAEWGRSPAVQKILELDQNTGAWSQYTVDLLQRDTRPTSVPHEHPQVEDTRSSVKAPTGIEPV